MANAIVMVAVLVVSLGVFAWTANHRWRLMRLGPSVNRADRVGERIAATLRFAFGQKRMPRYRLAGIAHVFIFFGFLVLLLRSLILFGRAFAGGPTSRFAYWIFEDGTILGNLYTFLKDVFVVLVVLGVLVFLYYRLVARLKRMTLSFEGLLVLLIIFVMMVADVVYDGAVMVHAAGKSGELELSRWGFAGSAAAVALNGLPGGAIMPLMYAGQWTHVVLVVFFLNLLPYSKHFHVITAIPNVFSQNLAPPGRLEPLRDIEGMIEREETLGTARIEQFSWKSVLDFYTCTECGRCSDHCPATHTGKKLSPKHLTMDLRDHLYRRQSELISHSSPKQSIDLIGQVIDPEVIWACTTCRACEEECPVFISYVDKIVDLRRYVTQEKGEFPTQLQQAFTGMESVGNPYSIPPDQRMEWAKDLNVPLISEKPDAEFLFWVGCAPASDDRSKKVARALVQLMEKAGVSFAVLGPQEQCTGDAARRAGNEYLFQTLAQANVETLNGHQVRKIVTICPHCFNTLKNEYPDFGGHYEVIHHADLLAQLVAAGRLKPDQAIKTTVVYHDSCYLGRYNGIYDSPRRVLASIPGVRLVEADASRDRGMCCGAGGAQMWKEDEPGDDKVNFARTDQLIKTGATTVASACPFCLRMLSDGINLKDIENVESLDVAEALLRSVAE